MSPGELVLERRTDAEPRQDRERGVVGVEVPVERRFVAERNTAVQLAFSDGQLTLDAGSGDEAQASESLHAEIDGDELTTGFNPQFLLDGLTAIDEAVVELAFTQASKPVVMSGSADESGKDPAFRYLLMPRRLLS